MDLLGTNSLQPVVLVGVGNLGRALLSYRGFQKEGFEVVAAFDIDAGRAASKEPSCEVLPMERLVSVIHESGVRMACRRRKHRKWPTIWWMQALWAS